MANVNWGLYDNEEDEEEIKPIKKPKSNQKKSTVNWGLYDESEYEEPEEIKPKKEFTKTEIAKDIAKQGAKGLLIGAGGSFGDLAELAGINKEPPSLKAQRDAESEILDRMNQPGYKPTFQDLEMLGSQDDILPPSLKIPTSKDLEGLNEMLGGPGEAETEQGRYAGRIGKLYGAGLPFGQVNPLPAVGAGLAGQLVEEKGGGPLLQAAAEIATLILSSGKSGILQSSAKKEVQQKIEQLRKIGYTEEEITLAINSASKGKKAGVNASKSAKTEQAFEDFAEHSDQMVSNILVREIPGIERGVQNVHKMASDAYQVVKDRATHLNIRDRRPFIDAANNVGLEIMENLGTKPEASAFLHRLDEALMATRNNPTANEFINFYQELNSMGNWATRSQKDRWLTRIKNGIKDTFRSEGREGRELANEFEHVNTGIRRAYRAEEVHDLLQKTMTQDGIDYKKLHKLFDKPDNHHLFQEVLGNRQTENLNLIAKTGKEIKDFDKSWKATHLLLGNQYSDLARGGSALYFLTRGNMEGFAAVLATKGIAVGSKKVAELFLTDPKFQNIVIRLQHAIKSESPKLLKSAKDAMNKQLKDEGIEAQLD